MANPPRSSSSDFPPVGREVGNVWGSATGPVRTSGFGLEGAAEMEIAGQVRLGLYLLTMSK